MKAVIVMGLLESSTIQVDEPTSLIYDKYSASNSSGGNLPLPMIQISQLALVIWSTTPWILLLLSIPEHS
jgi:isoleucyl-tRNA synthetase